MALTPEEKAELLEELKEDLKEARAAGDTQEATDLKEEIKKLKEDIEAWKESNKIQTVPVPPAPKPAEEIPPAPAKEEVKAMSLWARIWGV